MGYVHGQNRGVEEDVITFLVRHGDAGAKGS